MRRVVWSDEARAELREIVRYVAAENPEAAVRLASAIEAGVSGLASFSTGRPGRVEGTFERVLPRSSYIVAYEIAGGAGNDDVFILRVIHGARDWPEGAWPGDR